MLKLSAAEKITAIFEKPITVSSNNGEREIISETLANGRITYRLIQNECEIDDSVVPCYGIEIKSSLFGNSESEKITGITTKYEYAKELFDLLCDNLVTPISLRDITEDFIVGKHM